MTLYSYYVGLDLGQSQDYSALCVVEEALWIPAAAASPEGWGWKSNIPGSGWVSPGGLTRWQIDAALSHNHRGDGRPYDPPLSVRHLERFELGTSYSDVIGRVKTLLTSGPLREKRVALLVDKTGVGAGVVDSFVQEGVHPIPISIHGGDSVTREPHGKSGYRVPKRDLAGATQVLLQNKRLKIAETFAEAEILKKELLNFRQKIDPKTAHDSYSHWREGDHDDLVLAVAMTVWFRGFWNRFLDAKANRKQSQRGVTNV